MKISVERIILPQRYCRDPPADLERECRWGGAPARCSGMPARDFFAGTSRGRWLPSPDVPATIFIIFVEKVPEAGCG
ncbi:MAG: hypothetical protein KME26_34040 [Oscillatoria princeps RMCB-10]|nr:hypothetical protein [Oscillatoria princeps RMCB-10]